ncbi:hypothetical protein CO046_03445 [Candidatus Peregrinibacteria bacterium CG_4_9_14_0_2_um_filter_53_11]|nr:MAG: hypothetical protein CO046_03445 [Candidatus Peregrinibacteria bacterium CG_4_9_14_0_2_um_filter_53_11]
MFNRLYLAASTLTTSAGEDVKQGLTDKVASFIDFVIGQVPGWIAGFIAFILTIGLAKMAKAAVEARISDKVDEEHQEILILAGRVTYFGVMVVGITVALKIAGIDLTTILAAVAFGVGFALQDLIMNFLAGVMILVSRQFAIGDFIRVNGTLGKVVEIQTRATILKAIDGTKVIVPNAVIFRNQVTSLTTNPTRRITVPLYVSYDTDITYATKIALDVLRQHPKILKKPTPSIITVGYGDSCIEMAARFWVGSRNGWFKVRSEITQQMLEAFNAAGIVIPYNVIHLETSQDTKQEWSEAAKIQQRRIEDMQASEAIAASAPAMMAPAPQLTLQPVPVSPELALQPAEAQVLVEAPIAGAPQAAQEQTPAAPIAQSPTEPEMKLSETDLRDSSDSDGQA